MKPTLVFAALALAGCAQVEPPMVVRAPTQLPQQQVPVVSGPCVALADVEDVPPSAMPPRTASIDRLANGAATDALTYKKLAEKQNAMLRACAKGDKRD